MSILERTIDINLDNAGENFSKLNVVSPEDVKTSRSTVVISNQFRSNSRPTYHDINFVHDQQNIQNVDPSRIPKIVDVPVEEKLMDALKNTRERDTTLQFEQEIHEFFNSSARSIIFPPNLNSYKRMLIHCIAERFGLLHTMTQGSPEERCLLINKSLEMRIPRPLLVEIHIDSSEMTSHVNGVQMQKTYYNSYGAFPMRTMPQPIMVVDSAHSQFLQPPQLQQLQQQPVQSDESNVPNSESTSRPRIMKRQNHEKYTDFAAKDPQSWKVPMSAADKEKKYAETKARIFGEDQAEAISMTPIDVNMTPTQSTVLIADIGSEPLTRQDKNSCRLASSDDFSQITNDGVAFRGAFSSHARISIHAIRRDSNGLKEKERHVGDESHSHINEYDINDEMQEIQQQRRFNESSDSNFEAGTADEVGKLTQPSGHSPEILHAVRNGLSPSPGPQVLASCENSNSSNRLDGNNLNPPIESHSNSTRNSNARCSNGSGLYGNQRYNYNYYNGSNSPNISRNGISRSASGGTLCNHSKGNNYNGKFGERPSLLSRKVSGDIDSNSIDGGVNSKDIYSAQARDNRNKHTTVDPTSWKDARFIQRDKESEKLDPDFARRNTSPTSAPTGLHLYHSFNPIPYNQYSTFPQPPTHHQYQDQLQKPLQQHCSDNMQQIPGPYGDTSVTLYSNLQLQTYPVHGLANANTNMHYQPVYCTPSNQQSPGMIPQPQWIPVSHPMNGQFFPMTAGMSMAMYPPQMSPHTQFDFIHSNSSDQNPTMYYPPQQMHSPCSASLTRQVISQQPDASPSQVSTTKIVTPTISPSPLRPRTSTGNSSSGGGLNSLNLTAETRKSPPNTRRDWQGRHRGGGSDSPHGQGHPRWNNNR